jgi:hypothetical protein
LSFQVMLLREACMPVLCPLCWLAGRSSRGRLSGIVAVLVFVALVAMGLSDVAWAQEAAPENQGMIEGKSFIVEYLVFGLMVGLAIFAVGRSSRRT